MGQAQSLLEMGHSQIGAWLMQAWEMPAEIIVTLREHHNPAYRGEHEVYPHLVLVADHLLKRHEIGDAPSGELPVESLEVLGLDAERVEGQLEALFEDVSALDFMARQLAAD